MPLPTSGSAVARGCGRSYGDASLGAQLTISTARLDRIIVFDPRQGMLTCEAGVVLSELIDIFVPRGWFPPVTPGTKAVTVGGMVAADVHGKNHHNAGSFCDYVRSVTLALGDGQVVKCSKSEHADLFAATCGGMGLTGVVLQVTFQMIAISTARISQKTERTPDLDSTIDLFEKTQDSPYSVAWIDCLASGSELGRSILIFGHHTGLEELNKTQRARPFARPELAKKRMPFDLPTFVLNTRLVSFFNNIYFKLHKPEQAIVDLNTYFYPLDVIEDWNRVYGRRGFLQYQCVLPLAASRDGLKRLLTEVSRSGGASFLAVLKLFGRGSFGFLSFPMEGYTLALDFPIRPETFSLLERLDAIVLEHGGRLYLAKDARMSAHMVELGYPHLHAFRDVRRKYDLDRRFASLQSLRLAL